MDQDQDSRRRFLRNAVLVAGSAFALNACARPAQNSQTPAAAPPQQTNAKPDDEDKEVTATEHLMREHGILRRALIVYGTIATKLRSKPEDVAPDALQKTAKLFRALGEDYHQRTLEEAILFPRVKQKGGEPGELADILVVQHNRGREITDYLLASAKAGRLGANAAALANVLDGFVHMYETHTAYEDTILFPAWKDALTNSEYDEMSSKFDDLEDEQLSDNGFQDAAEEISKIESDLGLDDISQVTSPAPPAAG
jgi:hemerythrin-like domain-containing protein